MKLDVYVNYAGTCEEAFRFYEKQLGAKLTTLVRHSESPGPSNVPPEWKNKVLHAHLDFGVTALTGADIPTAEPMRSAYLTLTMQDAAEVERVYALLTEGGEVFMQLQKTFFASAFAMLRDRFGTSWMLLSET
jgi:PhnB protein